MKIELTYEWSELDKHHSFGIVFLESIPSNEIYIRWVYYYLGTMFKDKRPVMYPFSLLGNKNGILIKEYKDCNNAERQAKLLFDKMKSTLHEKRHKIKKPSKNK